MDKVQKIREEVVRMHNLLPVMDGDNISVNYADRICTTLEMYIDSLQEEPTTSVRHNITEDKLLNLRKLADAMYYASQHLTTDASRLHKAMEEYHQFIINEYHKEEPVSNDFEMALAEMIDKAQTSVVEPWVIAAQWKDELIKLAKNEEPVSEEWIEELRTKLNSMSKEDFKKVFDKYAVDFNEESVSEELEEACEQLAENARKHKAETTSPFFSPTDYKQGVIDGAKWQQEKEYTCYEEAFEDGASWKKEEMMKGAVDTVVHIEAGNYPYIPQIELYDYDKDIPLAKEGDKYKVILIKEG